MNSLSARIRFLIQFVRIPPEAWDFIFPHGPVLKSIAVKEQILAAIVRDISYQMTDRSVAAKVKSAGAEMVKQAAANLVSGWEDGDDICPPYWPWPWPGPFPGPHGPHPDFGFNPSAFQFDTQVLSTRTLAAVLKVVAKNTSLPNVAGQLNEIANRMAQQ